LLACALLILPLHSPAPARAAPPSYSNLWTTANKWRQWRVQWKEGPFCKLNATEMEENLTKAVQVIQKTMRYFKEGQPEIAEVAKRVREEMDELVPHLPLITALRNPGMRDRHWALMLAETKVDFQPKGETTLTQVLQMPLRQHQDVIAKVCARAPPACMLGLA